MRYLHVVAVAALIAASALVALTGPAMSRPPSADTRIDDAEFRPILAVAPVDALAMTTYTLDPADSSAGRLDADAPLEEPALRRVPESRPAVDQPASPVGIVSKNPWRYDPNVSFYGPGFYGNRTACGLAYTTTLQGVAHRTLPCGTRITFRNPANGRTVTVPVIDRGPYVAGRTWDLSGATCKRLAHCYTGPLEWKFAR